MFCLPRVAESLVAGGWGLGRRVEEGWVEFGGGRMEGGRLWGG